MLEGVQFQVVILCYLHNVKGKKRETTFRHGEIMSLLKSIFQVFLSSHHRDAHFGTRWQGETLIDPQRLQL